MTLAEAGYFSPRIGTNFLLMRDFRIMPPRGLLLRIQCDPSEMLGLNAHIALCSCSL